MPEARNLIRLALLSLALCPLSAAADQETARRDFFERRIRPVLVGQCFKCHSEGAGKAKGGLRLDSRAALAEGGDSGKVIDVGNPEHSLLLAALRYAGPKMPPDGKLHDHVAADFAAWIADGAFDPREAVTELGGQQRQVEASATHWAFQPLREPSRPAIADRRAATAIDELILANLDARELVPTASASPRVLLRRLHLDLTGLPPSLEEQMRFENQFAVQTEAAVAGTAKSLLASPRFGERWGRHWLDVVRFSETNGGDRNVIYPHAWRYRNYVIDSLNDDKPYDQFVREQLAGDLLDAASQVERDDQLIATGFLTLGPKLFMETNSERFRMDRVDEQIDVVSRAMLGLTISCARCHDHKFDPISARDYYALAGIFRSSLLLTGPAAPAGNQYGHDRPLQPIGHDGVKLHGPASAWSKQVADKTAERNKARSDRYRVVRQKAARENRLAMLGQGSSTASAATAFQAEIAELAAEIQDWDAKVAALDERLKELQDNPPPLPDYCMAVRDGEVEDCQICLQGDSQRRGDPVPRGIPQAIAFGAATKVAAAGSGRLELAEWIAAADNALASRVFVNRVWQHLFGVGIVPSADNFGVNGQAPTHPELLEYLAWRFVHEHECSVKSLISEIVSSDAYQRSSFVAASRRRELQDDPANQWLWRQNTRVLEVEVIRDGLLAFSGTLDTARPKGSPLQQVGKPELNATVSLSEGQLSASHRSVYLPIARFHLPRILETFDFCDPSLVSGNRSGRTTAAQQLFLLNDPWVIEQTRLAAHRLLAEAEHGEARVVLMYRRLFARPPTRVETERVLNYVAEEAARGLNGKDAKTPRDEVLSIWQRVCQSLVASAEFRSLE